MPAARMELMTFVKESVTVQNSTKSGDCHGNMMTITVEIDYEIFEIVYRNVEDSYYW